MAQPVEVAWDLGSGFWGFAAPHWDVDFYRGKSYVILGVT
jgi:hypothetical protein